MPTTSTSSEASTRRWLAVGIVGISIVGIVILATAAIWLAEEDRAEMSRLVFSAVLPLLGTWVGTVLAFYFARENLQAATESTLALAGRETAAPVTRVMIPEADFIAYDLGTSDDVNAVPLAAVHAKMREISPPSRRLPIRNSAGAVLYVIHDSTLTAFAESHGQATGEIDKALGDMLAAPEFVELIEAIGFVHENATVTDARRAMGSTKNCNDVFVTATGKREERAVGWLTNTLLAGVQ
jgi:hypothetical protein